MRPRSTIIAMTLALAAAGCASTVQRPADLTQLGVADAARLIRDKQVTSAELTQAYLARADANPDLSNTDPGSNAGIPGLTIPAGLGPTTGLPVGISLDGPRGSDERLLAIGIAIEHVLGRTPPPKR